MSSVTTRLVLVGSSVALAAVAVGQWAGHRQLERRYRESLQARRQLELEAGQLRADRDRLAATVTEEQGRVAQLSSAMSDKDTELQQGLQRLLQEERIIQELQGRLLAMQLQFDRLQGELAAALEERPAGAPASQGRMIELEKVVVTHSAAPAPGLQGRVLSVNPEWRFVVIDLGWDVVNIGDVVSIYRNDQLLGKARVERVQEQVCAAALLPEWVESHVQVNDVVRIL